MSEVKLNPKLPVCKVDRFSFECRKVIGFASLRFMIGLKNSRHFFIQSEVTSNPTVFSRVLRQLHLTTSSFDWLTGLSVSLVIGQSDNFRFGFTTLQKYNVYFYKQWLLLKISLTCLNFSPDWSKRQTFALL